VSRAGRYFSRRRGLAEFISAGPLAPVLEDLAAALEATGHCPSTIQGYLRAARHVTYCIERRQLRRRDLTLAGLRRFAREHGRSCRCPHPEKAASANFYSCMPHLLPLLQRAGVASGSQQRTPFRDELEAYATFMRDVRGLSDETRAMRVHKVSTILRALMPRERFEPSRLTAPALQAHVSGLAETRSPHTVRGIVAAIRDFLRFLQTRGVDASMTLKLLRGPRSASHLSSRKALTLPQTRALLAPLQARDPLAMRDLAIVLLLGQVGLRRTDVAMLQLHDIDARSRTVTIRRSKSRRASELPLPDEAREAVLRYVRHGRPALSTSSLFVTHAFPYDAGITASTVSAAVQRAFRRAGIEHPSKGAHVLRHTLATQLVAARQPLKAIADVMRHREIDTTARYVRVDLERLRAAVRRWPVEVQDGEPRAT
jgi:site-specific recombinase XerD